MDHSPLAEDISTWVSHLLGRRARSHALYLVSSQAEDTREDLREHSGLLLDVGTVSWPNGIKVQHHSAVEEALQVDKEEQHIVIMVVNNCNVDVGSSNADED